MDKKIETIYDLKLHEMLNTTFGMSILRVAGGWIYDCWDYSNETTKAGTFVPFNNEFQRAENEPK